jgi:DNA-binding MarR family transcriptional regulator
MKDELCFCTSLRKASRRLTAAYDAALSPLGINVAQFALLRNIDRHGPVSLTALGQILELDRSTLGRNVRVLGRLGLVQLAQSADKRETSVTLSGAGRKTLTAAEPAWQKTQDKITTRLGAGAAHLQALLGAL